jgi:hypothetical protein
MMRRRFVTLAAGLLVAGCSATDTTAPAAARSATPGTPAAFIDIHDGLAVPGSGGQGSASTKPLACTVDAPLTGSALIGPRGGELDVGPHRLIIPPGALDSTTLVSGSVPQGSTLRIDFQPEGLHFRKPAGLILDASSCGAVPNALYLDEVDGLVEEIDAVYSAWWHTIAAPIDHFSGYMLEV